MTGTDTMLNDRMAAAYEQTRQQLCAALYGDQGYVAPKATIRRKVSRWFAVRSQRIHDSWLVLVGKAEVYDGY